MKRFDVVLAYKIDRLSRSLKDLIDIVAELNNYNMSFGSLKYLTKLFLPIIL